MTKNMILSLAFLLMLSYNVKADFKSTVHISKPNKLSYADMHRVIPNTNKIKPKFIFPLYMSPKNISSKSII